jgi:hypothetical protein
LHPKAENPAAAFNICFGYIRDRVYVMTRHVRKCHDSYAADTPLALKGARGDPQRRLVDF